MLSLKQRHLPYAKKRPEQTSVRFKTDRLTKNKHISCLASLMTQTLICDQVLWALTCLSREERWRSQLGTPDGIAKMQTCAMCSFVLYIHTLWETLSPIIKNIHPYSEIWRALPPIRHTLVGKNYLQFFTLWKSLLPIMPSRWEVYMHQRTGTGKYCQVWCVSWHCSETSSVSVDRGERKTVVYQLSVHMYTSFSRCCFCHFDSITVIIMEDTAPDNYTFFI